MKPRVQVGLFVASLVAGTIAILASAYWSPLETMSSPGLALGWPWSRNPIERLDVLSHPMATKGWTERGIVLADNSVVRLPGFHRLPGCSPALSEATRQGVEVGQDGRVYGLVRVWHWCGNDPVRKQVARVDLSRLLRFLNERASTSTPEATYSYPSRPVAGRFSRFGWDVSECGVFLEWNDGLDRHLGNKPSNNRLKLTARGRPVAE